MKRLFLIVLLIGSGILTSDAQLTSKYWYVGDAKIACQIGDMVTSCLKVRTSPDSAWRDFPWEIEGFLWEPGTETLIELEETPLTTPTNEGQTIKYKLVRVVEVKNTVLKNKALLGASKWKLVNIEQDRKMLPMVKRANAWITFNLDSNTVSGFGGCNGFGGNAEVKEGEISFGQMLSTLKACPGDSIEKRLLETMVGQSQFYIRNNILFITCQNNSTLHFRPEKRIDSLVNSLNKPQIYRGNTYNLLRNGQYGITLDDVPESANKNYLFNVAKTTTVEKKTIKLKLINTIPDNEVQEVHILLKPHKSKDVKHAIVVFKDGTKRSIFVRNVL